MHRSVAPSREEGFTLAELLIVVVLLGILLAIAVPAYMGFTKKADTAAKASDAHTATITARGNSALDGSSSQPGGSASAPQQSTPPPPPPPPPPATQPGGSTAPPPPPPPPAAGQPGASRVGARPVVPPQRGRPSAPVRPGVPGRR
jgi:prepilin-type N-terminal cleavage/methylation domain-containing protein